MSSGSGPLLRQGLGPNTGVGDARVRTARCADQRPVLRCPGRCLVSTEPERPPALSPRESCRQPGERLGLRQSRRDSSSTSCVLAEPKTTKRPEGRAQYVPKRLGISSWSEAATPQLGNEKPLHVRHFAPLADRPRQVAGAVWGTRGPEFESRRPDTKRPPLRGPRNAEVGETSTK
jgi:hypothetical protein